MNKDWKFNESFQKVSDRILDPNHVSKLYEKEISKLKMNYLVSKVLLAVITIMFIAACYYWNEARQENIGLRGSLERLRIVKDSKTRVLKVNKGDNIVMDSCYIYLTNDSINFIKNKKP